jgi:hypothetical protein
MNFNRTCRVNPSLLPALLIALAITVALLLFAGCSSSSEISSAQWNDMWIDIAQRHKYERYGCGYSLEGYSKESAPRRVSKRNVKPDAPDTPVSNQQIMVKSDEIRAMEDRIAVLEEALKTNAAATNQNQSLIVGEIKALKVKVENARP